MEEGQPTSRNGEESGPPGSQYAGTRTAAAARCQQPPRRNFPPIASRCRLCHPLIRTQKSLSYEVVPSLFPLILSGVESIISSLNCTLMADLRWPYIKHESRDLNPCEEGERSSADVVKDDTE